MQFDASTIFVLALTLAIIVVLSLAEFHSRRRQKDASTGADAPHVPLSSPPQEAATRRSTRR